MCSPPRCRTLVYSLCNVPSPCRNDKGPPCPIGGRGHPATTVARRFQPRLRPFHPVLYGARGLAHRSVLQQPTDAAWLCKSACAASAVVVAGGAGNLPPPRPLPPSSWAGGGRRPCVWSPQVSDPGSGPHPFSGAVPPKVASPRRRHTARKAPSASPHLSRR